MLAQQVAEHGGDLVEAAGRVLGGAVRVEQFGVGLPGPGQCLGAGGEFGGRRAQQGLGVLGVARLEFLGEVGVGVAVLGRVPLGLAAQPAELFARAGHAGLQELHQFLGAGDGGLPGGSVGAVGRLEELSGAGADLVAEPVQFRAGAALVALRAGLLGAQVGAEPTFSYTCEAAR
ncbi:hypothetical protein STENM223S_05944 [Streptomyces tendae]